MHSAQNILIAANGINPARSEGFVHGLLYKQADTISLLPNPTHPTCETVFVHPLT